MNQLLFISLLFAYRMNVSAELNGQRLARSMRSLRSLPFFLGVFLSVVLARVRSRNLFFSRARVVVPANFGRRLKVPAILKS